MALAEGTEHAAGDVGRADRRTGVVDVYVPSRVGRGERTYPPDHATADHCERWPGLGLGHGPRVVATVDSVNRRERLASASLYLCTDARRERGDLLDFVTAALAGGVDIVQLRDKGSVGEREFGALEAGPELDLLAQLKELTVTAGALLAVNDRADIAVAADADVLHVGQDDLPVATARRLVGDDVLLGLSTHDAEQASAAAADPRERSVAGDACSGACTDISSSGSARPTSTPSGPMCVSTCT
mgnify:CR=1 FL=1